MRDGSSPLFLHRSVADALRTRISHGTIQSGSKLPALRDIAEDFGVSTMTVRRAIRTLEKERLVYRMPGVGVFAGKNRAGGVETRTTLAFVGADLSSPFQMEIARAAQRACQQQGWGIELLDAHFDTELEAQNIARLPDSGIQGAILLPPFSDHRTVRTLAQIQSEGLCFVVVDMTLPEISADMVSSDHEGGAYKGMRYLSSQGHTRVILLTHSFSTSSIDARRRGYERGLREMGIEARSDWRIEINIEDQLAGYREGRKWHGAYRAIAPVLGKVELPVAVLAIDAYASWGVYEACHELNLRIPEDVSVIGFDDTEIAHAMRPTTTILSQRTAEIGRKAIEILGERIRAEQTGQPRQGFKSHHLIEIDIVERYSVSKPAGAARTLLNS